MLVFCYGIKIPGLAAPAHGEFKVHYLKVIFIDDFFLIRDLNKLFNKQN